MQGLGLGLDLRDIAAGLGVLEIGYGCLDLLLLLCRGHISRILEHLLAGIDQRVGGILDLDLLLSLQIVSGKALCILDLGIDLLLGELVRSGDGHILLLLGGQILGRDMDDAIGIDIEGDLDLRNSPRCRWNSHQCEPAQGYIVLGHGPLTLQDIDLHTGLVVCGSGEYLAISGGNGGVSLNEPGRDRSQGLNAQRERCDIQKQQVLDLSAQDTGLDRRSHGHALHGVHAPLYLLAHEALDELLNHRHPGWTAHQNDLAYA